MSGAGDSVVFSTGGLAQGLKQLWGEGTLCDCTLVTDDGSALPCHKVCLAAASGYFRACFAGAGASMKGAAGSDAGGQTVVQVPDAAMRDVQTVIASIYEGSIQINPDNLERLLRLASFLEMPALLNACSDFMRQALQPSNAVPLLILASRYGCLTLRAELVSYICSKFSSMCAPLALPVPPPEVSAATYQHVPPSSSFPDPSWGPPAPRHVAGSWPHGGLEAGAAAGRDTLARISLGMRHAAAAAGRGDASALAGPRGSVPMPAQAGRTHAAWGVGPVSLPLPPQRPPMHPNAEAVTAAGPASDGGATQHAANTRHSTDSVLGDVDMLLSDDVASMHGDASQHGASSHGAGVTVGSAKSSPLCELPKDLLLEVLHSDELTTECEMDVLHLAVSWVAEDTGQRMNDLPELLQAVRVELIPASLPAVASADQSPQYSEVMARAQALLDQHRQTPANSEARSRSGAASPGFTAPRPPAVPRSPHAPPSPQPYPPRTPAAPEARPDTAGPAAATQAPRRQDAGAAAGAGVHKRAAAAFGRPRRPQPTMLVAAGGHDGSWRSLRIVEVYDPTTNVWSPGPSMTHSVSFAAGTHMDRDVVVVGGTPLWSCVSRLTEGGTRWATCPNLPSPRAHAGVVAASGSLFVVGGRSQVQATQQVLPNLEIYSWGDWSSGPPMTTPRSALSAVALRGGVFAIGGQTARSTLRTVERFDVGAETWTLLGEGLLQDRKYASAAVLNGRIYLIGGLDEMRSRLSQVESLDPREGRWQAVTPLTSARSSAGVAALQVGAHGRIYVAGGSAPGDHVHDLVEAYEPEMGRWVTLAPLSCGRSGLALCPL